MAAQTTALNIQIRLHQYSFTLIGVEDATWQESGKRISVLVELVRLALAQFRAQK